MRALPACGALLTQICALGSVMGTPSSHADAVAYLVSVTVRPGYDFPDAGTALRYGNHLCNEVGRGQPFASLVSNTMADFSSTQEYQATYLISQAINELCPQLIWQLRNSAVHYTGPAQ